MRGVAELLSMHLGPRDVLVAVVVRFRRGLSSDETVAAVDRIVRTVRAEYPEIRRLFVQPGRALAATEASNSGGQREAARAS